MHKVDAVFLDRDGVINRYLPAAYVQRPSQLELLPGVAEAVRLLADRGVPAIVISNQQGVGKGLMTAEDLAAVDETMQNELRANGGAQVTRFYYCTHLAEDGCACRKPRPGLIHDAAHDFDLDPRRCAFIGDSEADMQAASSAGVLYKLLVLSGATGRYEPAKFSTQPDAVFDSTLSAVLWLLEEDK